jgi:hypothetical protein
MSKGTKTEKSKNYILKNAIYLEEKFIKKGSKISLTEAQFKAIKGTNIEKELIEETK